MKLKKKESNYYYKIFYSYVAVFTLITLFAEILLFNGFYSKSQKVQASFDNFFESNYTIMENKILTVFKVVNLLSENEEIRKYAEANYSDYAGINFYSHIQIREQIRKHMLSFSDLECTLGITRMIDDIYIDLTASKSVKDYFKEFNIDIDSVDQAFAENSEKDDYTLLVVNESEQIPYVSIISRHRYLTGKSIYYIINFDKNYFIPAPGVRSGEFFAVINSKTNDFSFRQSRSIQDLSRKIKQYSEVYKSIEFKVVRKNEALLKRSGAIHNLIYIYSNPDMKVYTKYLFMAFLLFLLWLVLMIAGIYISHFVATKLYRPIHNIFSAIGDFNQEEKEDVNLLSNFVTDLINKNKKLQGITEQNRMYLKQSFIKDLLTGVFTENYIRSNLSEFELDYLEGGCLCIVVRTDSVEQELEIMNYQDVQMQKGGFMIAAEKYLKSRMTCEVVSIDRESFSVLTDQTDIQSLTKLFVSLVNEAEEMYSISLFVGIGKPVKATVEVTGSYRSAVNLLENKFFLNSKSVVNAEDMNDLDNIGFYYPIDVEKALIHNVLEGNTEQCNRILTNILNVNLYQLSLNKHNLTEFKFAITATVKRILKQMNKTTEDIFDKDMIIYLEINAAVNKAELEMTIRNIIQKISKYVLENFSIKKMEITKSILRYIHENYHHDLSLSEVAEHFCLSEGHIGRLLKNDINVSFKDYLNEYRVDVAKSLLTDENNYSVGEVSAMVGCNNVMTFIRMFKRYTGISPGEYKKSQGK